MSMKTHLTPQETMAVRRIIHEKTGYMIQSENTLNQIFRRSSLASETGRHSNEIFELIGDQVLSFYVIKIVSDRCGALNISGDYTFRINENRFTLIKQTLVNNEALAKAIDSWGITQYLLWSKSDIKNEVANQLKVNADLLEAILGAIAIESQYNAEVLETAVSKALCLGETLDAMIENEVKDKHLSMDTAITVLKELAESKQCTMPRYTISGPESIGYNEDGSPKWYCTCQIINDETGISRGVEATSKKDAKKAAAYLVLCAHFQTPNQYGRNSSCVGWIYKNGQLNPSKKQ